MEQVIRWLKVYLFFAVLTWAILAIAGSSVLPALALFSSNQSISNNSFNTRNLIAPTNLTANPAGHDVQLSWNAGQNGNGYAILGVANGTNSNCSGALFSGIGSTASTSYSDTGRFTPQGNYFCYQVKTTYGNWSSTTSNPITAAQIGFVATTVQLINGGTAGFLDTGDKIIINFNQPVNTTTGPASSDTVCDDLATNTIFLASTVTSGGCASGEPVEVGTLTGGAVGIKNSRYAAAYTWSNGNKTLTITIGTRIAGNKDASVGGTWTLNPTTNINKLKSSSGAFHICDTNSGGGTCLPTAAGQP